MGNDDRKKKIVFILNPISGLWHTKQNELEEILENHLDRNKYESEIRVTESPTHERTALFDKIKEDFLLTLSEEEQMEKAPMISRYFHDF